MPLGFVQYTIADPDKVTQILDAINTFHFSVFYTRRLKHDLSHAELRGVLNYLLDRGFVSIYAETRARKYKREYSLNKSDYIKSIITPEQYYKTTLEQNMTMSGTRTSLPALFQVLYAYLKWNGRLTRMFSIRQFNEDKEFRTYHVNHDCPIHRGRVVAAIRYGVSKGYLVIKIASTKRKRYIFTPEFLKANIPVHKLSRPTQSLIEMGD